MDSSVVPMYNTELDIVGMIYGLLIWPPAVVSVILICSILFSSFCSCSRRRMVRWNRVMRIAMVSILVSAFLSLIITWTYKIYLVMEDMELSGTDNFFTWFAYGPKPHRTHSLVFEAYQVAMLSPLDWFISSQIFMFAITFAIFVKRETLRLGLSQSWAFIWTGFIISPSFGFPLFLSQLIVNANSAIVLASRRQRLGCARARSIDNQPDSKSSCPDSVQLLQTQPESLLGDSISRFDTDFPLNSTKNATEMDFDDGENDIQDIVYTNPLENFSSSCLVSMCGIGSRKSEPQFQAVLEEKTLVELGETDEFDKLDEINTSSTTEVDKTVLHSSELVRNETIVLSGSTLRSDSSNTVTKSVQALLLQATDSDSESGSDSSSDLSVCEEDMTAPIEATRDNDVDVDVSSKEPTQVASSSDSEFLEYSCLNVSANFSSHATTLHRSRAHSLSVPTEVLSYSSLIKSVSSGTVGLLNNRHDKKKGQETDTVNFTNVIDSTSSEDEHDETIEVEEAYSLRIRKNSTISKRSGHGQPIDRLDMGHTMNDFLLPGTGGTSHSSILSQSSQSSLSSNNSVESISTVTSPALPITPLTPALSASSGSKQIGVSGETSESSYPLSRITMSSSVSSNFPARAKLLQSNSSSTSKRSSRSQSSISMNPADSCLPGALGKTKGTTENSMWKTFQIAVEDISFATVVGLQSDFQLLGEQPGIVFINPIDPYCLSLTPYHERKNAWEQVQSQVQRRGNFMPKSNEILSNLSSLSSSRSTAEISEKETNGGVKSGSIQNTFNQHISPSAGSSVQTGMASRNAYNTSLSSSISHRPRAGVNFDSVAGPQISAASSFTDSSHVFAHTSRLVQNLKSGSGFNGSTIEMIDPDRPVGFDHVDRTTLLLSGTSSIDFLPNDDLDQDFGSETHGNGNATQNHFSSAFSAQTPISQHESWIQREVDLRVQKHKQQKQRRLQIERVRAMSTDSHSSDVEILDANGNFMASGFSTSKILPDVDLDIELEHPLPNSVHSANRSVNRSGLPLSPSSHSYPYDYMYDSSLESGSHTTSGSTSASSPRHSTGNDFGQTRGNSINGVNSLRDTPPSIDFGENASLSTSSYTLLSISMLIALVCVALASQLRGTSFNMNLVVGHIFMLIPFVVPDRLLAFIERILLRVLGLRLDEFGRQIKETRKMERQLFMENQQTGLFDTNHSPPILNVEDVDDIPVGYGTYDAAKLPCHSHSHSPNHPRQHQHQHEHQQHQNSGLLQRNLQNEGGRDQSLGGNTFHSHSHSFHPHDRLGSPKDSFAFNPSPGGHVLHRPKPRAPSLLQSVFFLSLYLVISACGLFLHLSNTVSMVSYVQQHFLKPSECLSAKLHGIAVLNFNKKFGEFFQKHNYTLKSLSDIPKQIDDVTAPFFPSHVLDTEFSDESVETECPFDAFRKQVEVLQTLYHASPVPVVEHYPRTKPPTPLVFGIVHSSDVAESWKRSQKDLDPTHTHHFTQLNDRHPESSSVNEPELATNHSTIADLETLLNQILESSVAPSRHDILQTIHQFVHQQATRAEKMGQFTASAFEHQLAESLDFDAFCLPTNSLEAFMRWVQIFYTTISSRAARASICIDVLLVTLLSCFYVIYSPLIEKSHSTKDTLVDNSHIFRLRSGLLRRLIQCVLLVLFSPLLPVSTSFPFVLAMTEFQQIRKRLIVLKTR